MRLHNAAARSRVNQKRRQRITRQVRRFESLLPTFPETGRVALPALNLRPGWGFLRSRLTWSLLVLLAIAIALVTWVHSDDRWFVYREDVRFTGLTYLDEEELWRLSELDGWNVFWIDRDAVHDKLLQDPYVADAQVHIGYLGANVTVTITEVEPVALWETQAGTLWLRQDGAALTPRGSTPPGLLQILDADAAATAPGAPAGSALDPGVLRSAEALVQRLPDVSPIRYNAIVGLNFLLPGTAYWVYWGDGANVEQKLENLAAARQLLAEGRIEGQVIDVRFGRPYVK